MQILDGGRVLDEDSCDSSGVRSGWDWKVDGFSDFRHWKQQPIGLLMLLRILDLWEGFGVEGLL